MLPASATLPLAPPDRPGMDRPGSKGGEGSEGDFAGLMARTLPPAASREATPPEIPASEAEGASPKTEPSGAMGGADAPREAEGGEVPPEPGPSLEVPLPVLVHVPAPLVPIPGTVQATPETPSPVPPEAPPTGGAGPAPPGSAPQAPLLQSHPGLGGAALLAAPHPEGSVTAAPSVAEAPPAPAAPVPGTPPAPAPSEPVPSRTTPTPPPPVADRTSDPEARRQTQAPIQALLAADRNLAAPGTEPASIQILPVPKPDLSFAPAELAASQASPEPGSTPALIQVAPLPIEKRPAVPSALPPPAADAKAEPSAAPAHPAAPTPTLREAQAEPDPAERQNQAPGAPPAALPAERPAPQAGPVQTQTVPTHLILQPGQIPHPPPANRTTQPLPSPMPAPPSVASPAPPVAQVDGGLRWMLKGGAQEARLQLHPESLGQVTIHLKVEGGEVHARLWITEPASVQAVQEGRPHLEQSLREQGLQLGSFDLHQGHRPFQEGPSMPAPRPRDPAPLPAARQEAPAAPAPSILNPHRVELYA